MKRLSYIQDVRCLKVNMMHHINSLFLSLQAGFNNVSLVHFCQVGDESIHRIRINFMMKRD